jgi:hypothetical protein
LVLSFLAAPGPFVLDAVRYSTVGPDYSLALLPDGNPAARSILATPTPGAANLSTPPAAAVIINEWMAANQGSVVDPADGDFDDWFELYNPGEAPADLTGYRLTDDLTAPGKYGVPPGTTIPPHGFLVVWADEEGGQYQPGESLHASFKLNQAAELIAVIAPDGSVQGMVEFSRSPADRSEGRWPDGGPIALPGPLSRPTPGEPNAPPGAANEIRFVGIALGDAGVLTLTWAAEAGAVYRLEANEDLGRNAWSPIPTMITASGPTASASVPGPSASPHRFYRVTRPR